MHCLELHCHRMQRKWRTNRSALDTVVSYPDFRASIPPRDSDYSLADPTDLYSVYTVLHIESKQAELRWSPQGRFYYFLAQWEQAETTESQPQQHAAAPEGDEDPPPQVCVEVPTRMHCRASQPNFMPAEPIRHCGCCCRSCLKARRRRCSRKQQRQSVKAAVEREQTATRSSSSGSSFLSHSRQVHHAARAANRSSSSSSSSSRVRHPHPPTHTNRHQKR